MLVNCPRCGFSQPQDKYCARCGVDMETYRPPEPTFWRKTLGNPVIQVSFVLLIAGVVGVSLYRKERSDLQDRVDYLRGGIQIARSVSSPSSDSDLNGNQRDKSETETGGTALASASLNEGEMPPTGNGTVTATATATTAETASKSGEEAKTALRPGLPSLRLTYIEMPRKNLEQLFEEAQLTGQFNKMGDFIAGIVPDLEKKIAANSSENKTLLKTEKSVETGQALQWFTGLKQGDPENELGFTHYVELSEIEGSLFRGNIEIVRSWRDAPDAGGGPRKDSYPALFELARGSGLFMAGLLPARIPADLEAELVTLSPFQFIRSSAFRSMASDFVIFLEFVPADSSTAK